MTTPTTISPTPILGNATRSVANNAFTYQPPVVHFRESIEAKLCVAPTIYALTVTASDPHGTSANVESYPGFAPLALVLNGVSGRRGLDSVMVAAEVPDSASYLKPDYIPGQTDESRVQARTCAGSPGYGFVSTATLLFAEENS